MTGVIIALVSGILMSVQGVFNTQVTKQTSLWVSAGWVYRGMVFYRKAGGHGTVPGNAQVCAAWRSDRSRDHHYCNPEHEQSGTGAVGDADCDRTADRRMADRTVWMVWNGEDQL